MCPKLCHKRYTIMRKAVIEEVQARQRVKLTLLKHRIGDETFLLLVQREDTSGHAACRVSVRIAVAFI